MASRTHPLTPPSPPRRPVWLALAVPRLALGWLLIMAMALPAVSSAARETPIESLERAETPVPQVSTHPAESSSAAWLETGFLRGMTVTCPTWGPIWGSRHMKSALSSLDEMGVDWVAIHPYAQIDRGGAIRFTPTAKLSFLGRSAQMVRAQDMQFFLKPHLAYWGSFEWRGEIEFDEEEQWSRFFEGYRAFILDQARFAEREGIPLFAVGTELEGTTHREAEWRELISAVRSVYGGALIYAANWDRLQRVPFWDALDAIGVQAYYPLSDAEMPDRSALESGWKRHLAELGSMSRALGGKPVIFTEIGYNRAPEAAREPWSYRTVSTKESRQLRRLLLDVALERLEGDPAVRGIFWWKWMPGPSAGRSNFSMRDVEAEEALRKHWAPSASTRR